MGNRGSRHVIQLSEAYEAIDILHFINISVFVGVVLI
jgi:hypothetical protein